MKQINSPEITFWNEEHRSRLYITYGAEVLIKGEIYSVCVRTPLHTAAEEIDYLNDVLESTVKRKIEELT